MTKKKVSAQLKKARKLIEKGWAKGTVELWRAGTYHYCAVGALNKAVCGSAVPSLVKASEEDLELIARARGYLDAATPRSYIHGIIQMNDTPKVDKQAVLAVYDKAIANAQENDE